LAIRFDPVATSCKSPGNETFSGRCLHSQEYKNADAYRGKRAVVVGIGNSGGDIAVEISRSAEKVKPSVVLYVRTFAETSADV